MSDATDTAAEFPDAGAPAEVTEQPGSEATSQESPAGGFNEAWKPYADVLGGPDGMYFRQVQPLLAENDKRVNARFESIRNEYKPLEGYKDLGVDPDTAKTAVQILNSLNEDPVAFYKLLAESPFVAEQLAQAQQSEVDPADIDPSDITQNPQFQEMSQKVSAFEQMIQQQQETEQRAQADAQVDSEVQEFRSRRPDYTDADMAMLFNSISATYNQTGKLPSWDDAATQLDAYRDSIRSAPRPGAQAPLVMPTNGGAPSPNTAPSLGKLTSKQTQNLMAELLRSDAQVGNN